MADLTRIDVDRFVDGIKPLPKKLRIFLDAVLALSPSGVTPAVRADVLKQEISSRSGQPLTEAAFRQQLKRLNDALRRQEAPFILTSRDGLVVTEPTARWDADASTASLRQTLKEHSGEKVRGDFEGLVPPRARPEQLYVMFSYAWLEGGQQDVQLQFFKMLKAELGRPSEKYAHLPRLELWRDEERLDPGDVGSTQMDEACERAFLGILMLSTKYPHSKPCLREAAYFLDKEGRNQRGKRCIIVKVNSDLDDVPDRFKKDSRIVIGGPNGEHLLRHWTNGTEADRQDFVRKFALRIFQNADEWCTAGIVSHPLPDQLSFFPGNKLTREFLEARSGSLPHDEDHSVRPRARPGAAGYSLADAAEVDEAGGLQIVDHLVAWSRSNASNRPRLAALLGDFGMGKTVTCQLVTRKLLDLALIGEDVPVPIYFDLRDIQRPGLADQITLEMLIADMLGRSGGPTPSAQDVIRFARDESALVIFDGLDEVTNKLSPDAAKRVYRQLLSIVPTAVWNEDARRRRRRQRGGPGPSILISCRSQYFSDFASERSFLTDADRSGLDPRADMAAYVMLPFSGEQVREYLEKNLSTEDIPLAANLLEEIYDLGELAKRPILLRYIGEMVHRLEEEKLAGNIINITRLYDIIVEQAFQRDDPKHVIRITDKRKILQALALYFHRSGQEDISNARLSDWTDNEIMLNHPVLARTLAAPDGSAQSQIFLQDLRNATLLSRPGESNFRFAHTSMREYFLADALHGSVISGHWRAVWDVPPPSLETMNFILRRHEIAGAGDQNMFRAQFSRMLEVGVPLALRELAFRLWRISLTDTKPLPRPASMDCSGFSLSGQTFIGSKPQRLPLRNTDWSNANLSQVEFRDVDLSNSTFDKVDAQGASFVNVALFGSTFTGADLSASRWRQCRLDESVLDSCDVAFAEAHEVTVGGQPWIPQPTPHSAGALSFERRFIPYGLNSIAFGRSSEEQLMLTASSTGMLRLWDPRTGAPLRTFPHRMFGTKSAAFGEFAGRWAVVAGGANGAFCAWGVDRGNVLAQFEEDRASTRVIEFGDDDGQPVLVHVLDDGLIVLRDVVNGKALRTFETIADITSACVRYLNGRTTVLVGSASGFAAAWDLTTGKEVFRVPPGEAPVAALDAVHVQGRTLVATATSKGIIEIWDAATLTSLQNIRINSFGVPSIKIIEIGGRSCVVYLTNTSLGIWEFDLEAAGILLASNLYGCITLSIDPFGEGSRAFVGSFNGSFSVWDLKKREQVRPHRAPPEYLTHILPNLGGAEHGAFIIGNDGSIYEVDMLAGSILSHGQAGGAGGSRAVGRWKGLLAVAMSDVSGQIGIYNPMSGAELTRFDRPNDRIDLIAISSDSDRSVVVTASAGELNVVNADTGEVVSSLRHGRGHIYSLAVASDDQTLVAASVHGEARLWDFRKKKFKWIFTHPSLAQVLNFGTWNGVRILASGHENGQVSILEVKNGKCLASFRQSKSPVRSVAFCSIETSTIMAVGGSDGTVAIWTHDNREPMFFERLHDDWVRGLALVPYCDLLILISSSDDGGVRVTHLDAKTLAPTKAFIRLPGTEADLDLVFAPSGEATTERVGAEAWREWQGEYEEGGVRKSTNIERLLGQRSRGGPD